MNELVACLTCGSQYHQIMVWLVLSQKSLLGPMFGLCVPKALKDLSNDQAYLYEIIKQ